MKELEEKKQWVLCPWCGSKTRLHRVLCQAADTGNRTSGVFPCRSEETGLCWSEGYLPWLDHGRLGQGLCRGRKALSGTRRLRCRYETGRNANGQRAERVGNLCCPLGWRRCSSPRRSLRSTELPMKGKYTCLPEASPQVGSA